MAQVDGFGLNKAARLKSQREKQAAEVKAKILPIGKPFPGGLMPFDPAFFKVNGLSTDPEEG